MDLARSIANRLAGATSERITAAGVANAEINAPRIARSVVELSATPLGAGSTAIVVGAGPSLRRRQSLERLARSGFRGAVIASDGALGACLRSGVVPHVVVSVDPHPGRIVRWFGDPSLTRPSDDDYFRRQEMDPEHARDEVTANRELLDLVDAHGPRIKAAIATSASPAVVDRCAKVGMDLYWWNPMYDDYDVPNSVSRRLHAMNGLPCLNGGGNVGTAAWVLAHAVLGKTRLGLIGMDLGYPADMPYTKTQYYPELRELLGDRIAEAFVHVANPLTGEGWYCDPSYYWFRDVLLEMAAEAGCVTVNCTEGGILFGPNVELSTLEEFLKHG